MTKTKNKNAVYLSLDDLNKLYGIDEHIIKKIKKRQKKRRNRRRRIDKAFNRGKNKQIVNNNAAVSSSQTRQNMNDITYTYGFPSHNNNTSLIDNRDAQMIKEQINALKKNQNKLLITDMRANLVNNPSNQQILDELAGVKSGMRKLYKDGTDTFNYLFDNIGDFHQVSSFKNPVEEEEERQTENRLSSLSYQYEQPEEIEMVNMSNPLFYDERPSTFDETSATVEEKSNEPTIINEDNLIVPSDNASYGSMTFRDDRSGESIPENISYGENSLRDDDMSVLSEEVFVIPPRLQGESMRTYKSRVEYLRRKHNGDTITYYQKRRWENV